VFPATRFSVGRRPFARRVPLASRKAEKMSSDRFFELLNPRTCPLVLPPTLDLRDICGSSGLSAITDPQAHGRLPLGLFEQSLMTF